MIRCCFKSIFTQEIPLAALHVLDDGQAQADGLHPHIGRSVRLNNAGQDAAGLVGSIVAFEKKSRV